jgi:hypothetical protein
MCAAYPIHLILHGLITLTIFGEVYELWSSLLCIFLQPPVTSSLIDLNILLSYLFSYILSLCSSVSMRDQVSNPYKTTEEIIVLFTLIFTFLDRRQEDNRFEMNGNMHSLSLFSS